MSTPSCSTLLRGDDCALEDRDGLVALLAAADGFAFYEKVSKMITEVGFGEAQLHEALRRGVACKLHASVAKVDWVVGSAESVIDLLLYHAQPFNYLHQKMVEGANGGAAKVPMVGYNGYKWTVKEWFEKTSHLNPNDTKLLHWDFENSPLCPKESKHGKAVRGATASPDWLANLNWLAARPGESTKHGATFKPKLQLVHPGGHTQYHRDNNGADTWMKPLVGKALVACWSMADGIAAGLCEDDSGGDANQQLDGKWEMRWAPWAEMASARLFLLERGDVLLMPAGTYHYVYTIEAKLVLAGDFLNGAGWATRAASVARDHALSPQSAAAYNSVRLSDLLLGGVLRDAAAAAAEREPLPPHRRAYLAHLLGEAALLELLGGRAPLKQQESVRVARAALLLSERVDADGGAPAEAAAEAAAEGRRSTMAAAKSALPLGAAMEPARLAAWWRGLAKGARAEILEVDRQGRAEWRPATVDEVFESRVCVSVAASSRPSSSAAPPQRPSEWHAAGTQLVRPPADCVSLL